MPEEFSKLDAELLCEQSKELEDFLFKKIVNQSRAVQCVISAYDKFRSPIWQPEKPIVSALFLGPSGVGKTYIAEVLAEYFFDDQTAFTKIECANYVERHEISKLLGSPPGYIGYNDPPLLSQYNIDAPAIKHAAESLIKNDKEARWLRQEMENAKKNFKPSSNKQYNDQLMKNYMKKVTDFQSYVRGKTRDLPLISIILFDEIEKSHQSLHHLLLEITSKGKIHLGTGEETFFYNSFIFMTSNVGSRAIADIVKGKKEIGFAKENAVAFDKDEIYLRAVLELKKIFSTEFLGRIEKDIIVFRNLSRDDLRKIMEISLNDFLTHLAKNFPVELTVSDEIKNLILGKACDHPEYGARLIADKIDKYIKEPLTRIINSGQIVKGDKILINAENDKPVFLKHNTG